MYYAAVCERLALALGAALLGLLLSPGQGANAAPAYGVDVLARDLQWPTSVARLPDGRYLVTERQGRLLLIDGADVRLVPGTPQTTTAGSGGYLDVLVDPAFERTKAVFLSYAMGTPTASTTALFRGPLENDSLEGGRTILRALPDHAVPRNYGGRMLYQAGRQLLITIGDGLKRREEAQSLYNEFGKVLRINEYGDGAGGNPFQHPGALRIWSYGHRNPLGIAQDSERERVFVHELGARGGDELNLILPGRNYGWPVVARGVDFSGAQVTPFKRMSGLEDPIWVWPRGMKPSGMAWYDGPDFPELRGSLLVGSLGKAGIHRLRVHRSSVVDESWVLAELGERFVDVRVFDDGQLVLLTYGPSARLLRIRRAY